MNETNVLLGILIVALCIGFAKAEERTIAGVLSTNNGQWVLLEDQYHKPKNLATVTQSATGITVHYKFQAAQVRSVVVTGDEVLSGDHGVTCGPSVGLSYLVIRCSMPGYQGPVDPATLALLPGNIWIYGVFEDGE